MEFTGNIHKTHRMVTSKGLEKNKPGKYRLNDGRLCSVPLCGEDFMARITADKEDHNLMIKS